MPADFFQPRPFAGVVHSSASTRVGKPPTAPVDRHVHPAWADALLARSSLFRADPRLPHPPTFPTTVPLDLPAGPPRAPSGDCRFSPSVLQSPRAGHPTPLGAFGSVQRELNDACRELARDLVNRHAIPQEAVEDAVHIAIAAVHGIDYLLTWNCAHIANAQRRDAIEQVCRDNGYEPPLICTPEELLGEQ